MRTNVFADELGPVQGVRSDIDGVDCYGVQLATGKAGRHRQALTFWAESEYDADRIIATLDIMRSAAVNLKESFHDASTT